MKKIESAEYFSAMTIEQALQYCYKHEKIYVFETDQRTFDSLIGILEGGTIEPEELPNYGMDYGMIKI